MSGRNFSRYEQFEISPEMIEQELRPAVCEQRQAGRQTDKFQENYSIDYLTYTCLLLPLGSGYIYWVDNEARTISRIKRDLTQRQVIIGKGIVGCEGMAVDWIAG